MNPWASLEERVRGLPSAARYLVVGGLSFAIDIGVLALAWHLAGLPLGIATSCGFWASFSVNFVLSRHWTFGAAHHPSGAQLVRYVVLVAINYVVTVVAVSALHHAGFEVLAARTLTLMALTASTYFLYRNWVFATR